jgi:hypothetical protein
MPFTDTIKLLGGTQLTFGDDLDQAWRLYKLHALVINATSSLHISLREKACANFWNLIVHAPPRRVWLYVKHRRWMLSDEYANLQKEFIGTDAIFAAKTNSLLRAEPEDLVVIGRSPLLIHVRPS